MLHSKLYPKHRIVKNKASRIKAKEKEELLSLATQGAAVVQ
jgi:hypothetical protein